jgi:hypothetical protein
LSTLLLLALSLPLLDRLALERLALERLACRTLAGGLETCLFKSRGLGPTPSRHPYVKYP